MAKPATTAVELRIWALRDTTTPVLAWPAIAVQPAAKSAVANSARIFQGVNCLSCIS